MTKLYTGTQVLSKGSFYMGSNHKLWGKTTIDWVEGELQLPKDNDTEKEPS